MIFGRFRQVFEGFGLREGIMARQIARKLANCVSTAIRKQHDLLDWRPRLHIGDGQLVGTSVYGGEGSVQGMGAQLHLLDAIVHLSTPRVQRSVNPS